MAAYPDFDQVIGSSREFLDDLQVDEAVDGSARSRAFFPAVKVRLRLVHKMTEAEIDTLMTFYNANRVLPSVDVQWKCDGPIYVCVFAGPPQIGYDNPVSVVEVGFREV